jgi:D-alanine-D-alanine ligase
MTKIHVLAGDKYSERDVSLRSGAAVAEALKNTAYDVAIRDPSKVPLEEIADCDAVFPALHGMGGEDGSLQAALESRGVRYVGSDSVASALCFDKERYRQVISSAGLPVAKGALVQADTYQTHALAGAPYVLKPFDGGSSIDTYIVRDPADAPHKRIQATFQAHPTMLMEALITGSELTVGVLEDQALPVIEIIPPADGEFDYENKYNGATQELCPPQHVSEAVQAAAQELALQAHKITGCRDLSRTDIMCDEAGNLYILETNTLPGMTNQSLFPKAAAAAGIDMSSLCAQLVELALKH